jgi:hypothetical protein
MLNKKEEVDQCSLSIDNGKYSRGNKQAIRIIGLA